MSNFLIPTHSSLLSNVTEATLRPKNGTLPYRSASEVIVGTVTLCIIIFMTISGNFMVVGAIFTYRPLKKVQNFFLVSLAVADLTVAIAVMPFHVVKFVTLSWPFGLVVCQIWLTLDIWLCTASILNLCVIALDRYWAIHDPINYANRRTFSLVFSLIGAAWVVSAIISVPPLLGWNDWSQKGLTESCEYTTEKGFVVYSSCGSFFVPLAIMSVVYVRIFIAARDRLRTKRRRSEFGSVADIRNPRINASPYLGDRDEPNSARSRSGSAVDLQPHPEISNSPLYRSPSQKVRTGLLSKASRPSIDIRRLSAIFVGGSSRRATVVSVDQDADDDLNSSLAVFFKRQERISVTKEKKAAKTLAIIMGVFVLCWLPFFFLYVLQPFCNDCIHVKIFEATNWLGYINSSLNPIIYTIFNTEFRSGFRRIFEKLFRKRF